MLTKLREIQRREELSDAAMADRLNIARSTWTEIRNGRLVLSPKVQMAAAQAFPELLGALVQSVSAQTDEEPR
jgi:transcriptional regulator with XRE-family HTH domain